MTTFLREVEKVGLISMNTATYNIRGGRTGPADLATVVPMFTVWSLRSQLDVISRGPKF